MLQDTYFKIREAAEEQLDVLEMQFESAPGPQKINAQGLLECGHCEQKKKINARGKENTAHPSSMNGATARAYVMKKDFCCEEQESQVLEKNWHPQHQHGELEAKHYRKENQLKEMQRCMSGEREGQLVQPESFLEVISAPARSPTASAIFSVPALMQASHTTRICVYGDSMTAGFPCYEPFANSMVSTLAGEGISAEAIVCGLCGLTAVEMAHELDSPKVEDRCGRVGQGLGSLLKEQGPFDLVIVMAGTNDLAVPDSSAEQVLDSLKRMHAACWERKIPTIALSVPESAVTGTTQYPEAAERWSAINKAIAAWAQAMEGDLSLTSPFFADSTRLISFDFAAMARGLWEPDSLHFTAAGSREFGNKLAPRVASHLQGRMRLPIFVKEEDDESRKPRITYSKEGVLPKG